MVIYHGIESAKKTPTIHQTNMQKFFIQVIQSDLFSPYLEVTNNLWRGHVNSPSQKGHVRRIANIRLMVQKSGDHPVDMVNIGLSPLPVTVTTKIITFLVGDPYKPSFATVTGRGDNPR